MSKTEQDKSYFLAFCIEQYKVVKGIEVLHTQSRQWPEAISSKASDYLPPADRWRELPQEDKDE